LHPPLYKIITDKDTPDFIDSAFLTISGFLIHQSRVCGKLFPGGPIMEHSYVVVLITVPSRETGQQIANLLLERKLAACINILSPVTSIYTWEGRATTDEEALLIVKTRQELFEEQLAPAVQAAHPYDVPEIIALPVLMGSRSYLDWIDEVTQQVE
jgi:periplasmic divalent cation tolerance protein